MKLISSTNTRKAERIIRGAAAVRFGRGRTVLFYEHGQWFATIRQRGHMLTDEVYSVVDSIPGVDHRGIDFEAL